MITRLTIQGRLGDSYEEAKRLTAKMIFNSHPALYAGSDKIVFFQLASDHISGRCPDWLD